MRERLLRAYARWVVRNANKIALGAFVIAVLALTMSILFLKTQTGILDLYSEKEPVAKRFIEYIDKFGAAETLVIVFEGDTESERRRAMDTLAGQLNKDPQGFIKDVFYKIDLQLFKEHAFQFLNEEDAQAILREVQKPDGGVRVFFQARDFNDYLKSLNRSIEKGLKTSKMPQKDVAQDFARGLTPLFLLNEFLRGEDIQSEAMTTRLQGDVEEKKTIDDLGYLRTDDRSMHIMLIRPVDVKQDHKVATKMVNFVRHQIEGLKQEFPEVTIGVTGGPALNKDQFEISEKDMTLASLFAFFSTGVIFILAFKSFGRPLLGLLTLAIAILCTFGFTAVTVGHLNIFSLAFIVILVGQGTYYGVHVVSRYEEELLKGRSVPEAIQETIVNIFGNITTSTITTSSAFFATMFVPLKGFAELGFIAGMGILISSTGMQMLLPSFLMIYDRKGPRGNLEKSHQSFFGENFRSKWIAFSSNLIIKRSPYLIVLVLAVSVWGAYYFFSPSHGIPFDSNLLNLQAKDTEAVIYEKKLIETSLSPRAGIFLVEGLQEAQRVAGGAKSLPSVQRVEWLGGVLPEGTIQGETHNRLRRSLSRIPQERLREPDLTQMAMNLTRLQKNLEKISERALGLPDAVPLLDITEEGIDAIQEISEKIPVFDEGLDQASKELLAQQYILPQISDFQNRFFPAVRNMFIKSADAKKLQIEDVPPEIVSRFIADGPTYAIYAYPKVNIWEKESLNQFVHDLRSVSPDVTGPPIMFFEILTLVRTSYFKAGAFSALAIFIIFLIDFKSLRYSFLAFLPLILGIFSLFGLMSLFNLNFNTANMIALPMILGIGADNGVHMIHRFREEKETSIGFLFQSTGKALLITYLDTLTSFVGLAFANHQGLAQLGRVVILGITCCTIAGILFLPAVMVLIIKQRAKTAGNSPQGTEGGLQGFP